MSYTEFKHRDVKILKRTSLCSLKLVNMNTFSVNLSKVYMTIKELKEYQKTTINYDFVLFN